MEFQVDGWNNFCRVFELPEDYPRGFCTGGGNPVNFQMVDWFNAIPGLASPACTKEVWEKEVGPIETKPITLDELESFLIPFLEGKIYVKPGREYLVICNFGACFTFTK